MKTVRLLAAAAVLLLAMSGSLYAEDKVTGTASAGVFNRYVFRGYELSTRSFVLQPALSASYKGFSMGLWGNIDSDEHRTQSFVPDRPGRKSFNETDLTLSYSKSAGKLGITAGYVYYGTKYVAETEEVFLSLGVDTLLKPTLAVYRDIAAYPVTYINLALAHSVKVYKDASLDLSASAGYFSGDDDYWKTYDASTAGYNGKKYSAFHDGSVKAAVTIPVDGNLSLQPSIQYTFPLSDEASRSVDGNNYNPNGKLDETFVAGVNLTLSF